MDIEEIATKIARHLAAQAVLCYGSYAKNMHDQISDIDLLVLMPHAIPPHEARKRLYLAIERAHILDLDKKNVGGWDNSWSPVNDRLEIEGIVVEIGYNTTPWVLEVIDGLINKHKSTLDIFAFRPYTFLGLLETCQVLFDHENFVANCRKIIRPMPVELKHAIAKEHFPVLVESVDDLIDCGERNVGILAYLFFLERAIDAACQLLFIINDIYDPASKRTEVYLKRLKKAPPHLTSFLDELLPRFYENKEKIASFFKELIQFSQHHLGKF